MEKAIEIIDKRITKYKDEIESFEMNDSSFINSKRIKYLSDLIRELKSVKEELNLQS